LNPLKKLAGQTAIYGMGTIIPRLLNYLLLTPFYTNIFATGQYGIVTELYAYVAFLMVLLTYGMETAFFRYAELEKSSSVVYSTSLISLFTTSFVFIIFVSIFAQPIADLIQYSANKEYIVYFAFIVGIDAFSAIPFARLRQQNRALRFTIIKIINVCVNIGFNLYFLVLCPYLSEHNPQSPLLSVYSENVGVGYAFISNLIATLVTLLLLLPEIVRIKPVFDVSLIKRMLKYAYPLLIIGLAGMINEVADKILLKYLLPDSTTALAQVGIYGANYKLAVLMTLFIQMFRYAAEPFFFSEAKKKDAKRVYADVMKFFVIFCLIIFLFVMMYIDVVKYFIGPDFRSGLGIVPIVLLANLFLGVFYNLSVWYKLNNLTLYGALIAVAGACITIILNVALIPKIGYVGSAWGHFFCYFSMMIISFFWGRKVYPVNYDIKKILLYSTLAFALFGLSKILYIEKETIRLVINTFYLLVFFVVIYVFEKSGFARSFK
jgi:O-antigen/teichoic acid export membrane protein